MLSVLARIGYYEIVPDLISDNTEEKKLRKEQKRSKDSGSKKRLHRATDMPMIISFAPYSMT